MVFISVTLVVKCKTVLSGFISEAYIKLKNLDEKFTIRRLKVSHIENMVSSTKSTNKNKIIHVKVF